VEIKIGSLLDPGVTLLFVLKYYLSINLGIRYAYREPKMTGK